mgnify:CR=1 FL=1
MLKSSRTSNVVVDQIAPAPMGNTTRFLFAFWKLETFASCYVAASSKRNKPDHFRSQGGVLVIPLAFGCGSLESRGLDTGAVPAYVNTGFRIPSESRPDIVAISDQHHIVHGISIVANPRIATT